MSSRKRGRVAGRLKCVQQAAVAVAATLATAAAPVVASTVAGAGSPLCCNSPIIMRNMLGNPKLGGCP